MAKREKVYCSECKHYFMGRKNEERCLVAETITVRGSESYRCRAFKREMFCWEKNEKNKCLDYISKPEMKL